MRLVILDNSSLVGDWSAKYVMKRINDYKPGPGRYFVLGLPTGSTPMAMYKKLIEFHKAGRVSFKYVKTFNMDEYVGKNRLKFTLLVLSLISFLIASKGLPRDHPESYHYFMWNVFFKVLECSTIKFNLFIPAYSSTLTLTLKTRIFLMETPKTWLASAPPSRRKSKKLAESSFSSVASAPTATLPSTSQDHRWLRELAWRRSLKIHLRLTQDSSTTTSKKFRSKPWPSALAPLWTPRKLWFWSPVPTRASLCTKQLKKASIICGQFLLSRCILVSVDFLKTLLVFDQVLFFIIFFSNAVHLRWRRNSGTASQDC